MAEKAPRQFTQEQIESIMKGMGLSGELISTSELERSGEVSGENCTIFMEPPIETWPSVKQFREAERKLREHDSHIRSGSTLIGDPNRFAPGGPGGKLDQMASDNKHNDKGQGGVNYV